MTVKFIDPIKSGACLGPNPARPNGFTNILNGVNGVYIYGVKLIIENQCEKFVPLYVGQGDLIGRLSSHYNGLMTLGNSLKELFRLNDIATIIDLLNLYQNQLIYDSYTGAGGVPTHPYRVTVPSLIFYNNINFFNTKLGLVPPIIAGAGIGQAAIIPLLLATGNPAAIALANDILNTKAIYTTNFHFIYATLNDIENQVDISYPTLPLGNRRGTLILERVEYSTKKALQRIGINTTADTKDGYLPMNIDLNAIQGDLVNLGGHSYGEPYRVPLQIQVP